MISSENVSLEAKIIGFALNKDLYSKVCNYITRDMFAGKVSHVWDCVVKTHNKYDKDISFDELVATFCNDNAAMPESARAEVMSSLEGIQTVPSQNTELQLELVKDFWRRHQAKLIGEKAVDIYLGHSTEVTDLKHLFDRFAEDRIDAKETYEPVHEDYEELLHEETQDPDFPFSWGLLHDNVPGLYRGNLGIIFARPETGKTTFCAFTAAQYIKQGKKVVYWANEEPAKKIKLRIIQSCLQKDKEEMRRDIESDRQVWQTLIKPHLTIMDSVGTSIEELDEYCSVNKPDVVFCDQLDKFKIGGEYNRGDERLKEIYVRAREVAKRNDCLVWAVCQANYEAHDRQWIDFSMMDGSRTGKAGEADIIIGIGKTGEADQENVTRHVCVSKNKINGYHGIIHANIDVHRGVYY